MTQAVVYWATVCAGLVAFATAYAWWHTRRPRPVRAPQLTTSIPARTPDGEDHHVLYEGPAHLLPSEAVVVDLPALPEGERWVLVHRRVEAARPERLCETLTDLMAGVERPERL